MPSYKFKMYIACFQLYMYGRKRVKETKKKIVWLPVLVYTSRIHMSFGPVLRTYQANQGVRDCNASCT